MQVVMNKSDVVADKKIGKSMKVRARNLTFCDSYSIIPALLAQFCNMFKP